MNIIIYMCVYMYLFSYSSGKFTTNLSPYWKIRQIQNTTSCRDFDTINSNLD